MSCVQHRLSYKRLEWKDSVASLERGSLCGFRICVGLVALGAYPAGQLEKRTDRAACPRTWSRAIACAIPPAAHAAG
eukprot:15484629-Alexandrium_andersonii.AAC.1